MNQDYKGYDNYYQKLFSEGKTQWGGQEGQDVLYACAIRFIRPRERVLLLGCGVGILAERLKNLELDCIGVDISSSALAKARERLAGCENYAFVESSVLDLPDTLGLFDLIMDEHCTHCIVGADRAVLWKSLQHRLKLNGRVIIKAMVGDAPRALATQPELTFEAKTCTVFSNGKPIRYVPTFTKLKSELELHGFEVLSAEHQINPETEDHALIEVRKV